MNIKELAEKNMVQTRDGRKVRILATDRKGGEYPIIGLVTDHRGDESFYSWTTEGKSSHGLFNNIEEYDLVPAPVVRSSDFPWSFISEKYQWAAMDENGTWWIYSNKPYPYGDGWCFLAFTSYKKVPNWLKTPIVEPSLWEETLIHRPER